MKQSSVNANSHFKHKAEFRGMRFEVVSAGAVMTRECLL